LDVTNLKVNLSLVLGLSLLAGACGSSPSAPASPTAPTAPIQYSLSGFVSDTAFRPIPSVTIEVVEGSGAGVRAVTDERGQFQLPGSWSGGIVLRASKDGYRPRTQTYETKYAGPQSVGFTLELDAPSPDISGTYTLTFVADSACTELPAVARSRTYTATIKPSSFSASANQYVVALSGATFYPSNANDSLGIGIAGTYGRVTTFDYGIGVAEELAPSTYVHIWGVADVSVQGATISGPLSGGFEYCQGSGLGPGFYRCGAKPVVCERPLHRITLTRR
jgi:hypothetical protein